MPSNPPDHPLHQAGSGVGGGGKKGKGKKGKGMKGRTSPDPEDDEVAQVCTQTYYIFCNIILTLRFLLAFYLNS